MRIEPFDIMDLVHGSLHTAVTAEGEVRFARFTEEQKETYYNSSEIFGLKCSSSASVMLDFYSDTDFVEFEAELIKCTSHSFAAIDLLVDNVLYDSIKTENPTCQTIRFSLPQGMHRITLVLPWSSITLLRNLTISDNAQLIPIEKGLRILALGDSITQGSICLHPSMSYVSYVARNLDAEVLNQGVGGYQFLKESLLGAPDWQPDLITLAYGTNDFSLINRKADFAKQVSEYVDTLCATYPDTTILAITPIYRGDLPTEEKMSEKDYTFTEALDIIREIYAKYPQIKVLEGFSFFPRHKDFFAPDYLHPNDQGFLLYGRAVEQAIRELL